MANEKALRLIELGLHPVLLGSEGDSLKRPLLKGWQTAVYTAADARRWPSPNNVGIRCGRQRNGHVLLVFDFDEEAARIFPAWRRIVSRQMGRQPVIVSSGRGYHVYFFSPVNSGGKTLAGRYIAGNGRKRLVKFIELLGAGRQVVAAGSRHPGGKQYRFVGDAGYADIPVLSPVLFRAFVALARVYDERPPRRQRPYRPQAGRVGKAAPETPAARDCLEYARRYIGAAERVERNGDIRFLGHGGLLITADGRGWYSFSEETGGGLAELVAWHQALAGEGR